MFRTSYNIYNLILSQTQQYPEDREYIREYIINVDNVKTSIHP